MTEQEIIAKIRQTNIEIQTARGMRKNDLIRHLRKLHLQLNRIRKGKS